MINLCMPYGLQSFGFATYRISIVVIVTITMMINKHSHNALFDVQVDV